MAADTLTPKMARQPTDTSGTPPPLVLRKGAGRPHRYRPRPLPETSRISQGHCRQKTPGKLYPALLPSAEYTLETGIAFDLTGSLAFYTGNQADDNISNIYLASVFTIKKQILMPLQANIWTKGNKYNIVTDWRFEIFPQNTYGLGTLTTIADADSITFDYLRFYSTVLKTVAKDFYLGFGYDVDYFYNVRDLVHAHAGPSDRLSRPMASPPDPYLPARL